MEAEEVKADQSMRVSRHHAQYDKYSDSQGSEKDKTDELYYQRHRIHALDLQVEDLPSKFCDKTIGVSNHVRH